jgi:hypothetical protein
MLKAFVPAAIISIFAMTPATAAPQVSTLGGVMQSSTATVQQVQHRHRHRGHRHRYNRHGYRAGHRYRRAPHGWRRYHARPYGWRTRGCIVVGPVWFCP